MELSKLGLDLHGLNWFFNISGLVRITERFELIESILGVFLLDGVRELVRIIERFEL